MSDLYDVVPLSTVVKINSGIALPKIFKDVEFTDGEYEFFKVAQMNNDNKVMKNADLKFTLSQSKKFKIKLFPKGSILIPKRGGAILTNKKRILLEDASYDSNIMGLKANNGVLTDDFLVTYMDSIDLSDYIDTSTIPQINNKHIEMMMIPLPPLSEQKRIVSKLDKLFEKIDKAIALHQKNRDEANLFIGSVLNDVFGELEEKNYPILRFDTYTKLSRGHNPPKKDFIHEPKDGYIRFIQIRDGSSDKNAVYVPITKKLHLVTKEDLLLVAYRQVGKVFRDMEGAFNVALCKIINNDKNNLDTTYLYYLIQSKYVKGELLKRSERALIPSMSVEHLKSIKIPTPPLNIQQKAVKYLDEISAKIEKLKQEQKEKMNNLKALKASILDKAFKGEL